MRKIQTIKKPLSSCDRKAFLFDGEPWGTRTSGPQLRRLLLYPAELMTLEHPAELMTLERVMGIEPTWSAWKAEVLPLNYTRIFR